jgi:ribosomal protein S14
MLLSHDGETGLQISAGGGGRRPQAGRTTVSTTRNQRHSTLCCLSERRPGRYRELGVCRQLAEVAAALPLVGLGEELKWVDSAGSSPIEAVVESNITGSSQPTTAAQNKN